MRRRPKVVYIIPAEGFGGAERQAVFHFRYLSDYGFDIIAITGPGRKVSGALKDIGIDIRFIPYLPKEYGKPFSFISFMLHTIKNSADWLHSLHVVRCIVKKEKPDVLFAGRVAGWSLAAPVGKLYGIPTVWRFGSCVHGTVRRGILRWFGNLFPPDAAIANCNAVKKSVEPLVRLPIQIVPNGIEDRFLLGRKSEKKQFDSAQTVVGLAIRPSPDKGMTFLREVVSIVNKNGIRVHFRIAGEFGWRDSIQMFFNKCGLSDSVTFMGYVEDIIQFYNECDIIALTSRSRSIEGFPNSLLEAMALGKPVISTSAGGVSELVENGVTGVVVNVGDSRSYAGELLRLAENPSYRKKLGDAAAKTVRELYTKHMIMRKLTQCIEDVMKGKVGEADVRERKRYVLPKRIGIVPAAVLTLLTTLSSDAENVSELTYAAAERTISTVAGSTIPLNEFDVIGRFSGNDNYYSILSDEKNGTMIHADYRPPMKTVIFGYRFPDSVKRIDRLNWEWRVVTAPKGSRENIKGKNDSGASVYLLFKKNIMTYTIKYVFSDSLPVDTTFEKKNPNPFNLMQMVVISNLSESQAGNWVPVQVDVASEFRRLFNAEHSVPLRGVGILTDGDQTGSRVIAEYRNFTYSQTE